jgi:hypothetical protein
LALRTFQTNRQRIASEWRNHLETFVDKPALRPYFEGQAAVRHPPACSRYFPELPFPSLKSAMASENTSKPPPSWTLMVHPDQL